MPVPEWLFGPAGDLRPLPSPEMDVVDTVERIGGIHTAINGSRTVDTLGYKSRYEFEMKFLDVSEYSRLEAVYTGQIPGDLYLTNPMKKNLLSIESSSGRPSPVTGKGVYVDSGQVSWVQVTDSPVTWSRRAAAWTVADQESNAFFDYTGRVPSITGSDFTFSVYVRCLFEVDVIPFVQPFYMNVAGTTEDGGLVTVPADSWTRVDMTVTGNTAVADTMSFGLRYDSSSEGLVAIQMMCPQVEIGSEPTEAVLGGGSTRVAVEDMTNSSPYYPLRNVSLSLLEV